MNPATSLDRFVGEISAVESRIIERLKRIIKSRSLTDLELTELIASYDFYNELQKAGYSSALNRFVDDMENAVTEAVKQADKSGTVTFGASVQMLDNLVQLNTDYLLRRASAYGEELRRALLQPLIAGTSRDDIINTLLPSIQADVKFYPNWMVTVVTQSLTQLQTTAQAAAFADSPQQRFILKHPIDRNTRRLCLHAIQIQKEHPEGFTREEIDAGALNKGFVKRTPSENDKYDFINLGGFNCRGYWSFDKVQ